MYSTTQKGMTMKVLKNGLLVMAALMIAACSADDLTDYRKEIGPGITDFGDRNAGQLKTKMRQIAQGGNQVVAITQFGDSHSAADFFTGGLRDSLQAKLGNAGIGWVTPMNVRGQRHAEMTWRSSGWDLTSSRTVNDLDFPMGGYIASPVRVGGAIDVTLTNPEKSAGLWDVRMVMKARNSDSLAITNDRGQLNLKNTLKGKGRWQTMSFRTPMPFRITAENRQVELGGMWLQQSHKPGAIVSSIATNGAKLSIWNKWSPEWYAELSATRSDLVILEYGTNEAFNDTFDIDAYRRHLVDSIRNIRMRLPNAAILLLSPPDALLRNASGSCQDRTPPSYEMVKQTQYQVARSERVLYWDWQQAMGGPCSIEKWEQEELAGKDKVHLTSAGYKLSARLFYRDLMSFVGLSQ